MTKPTDHSAAIAAFAALTPTTAAPRRRALGALGLGALTLAACGGGGSSGSSTTTTTASSVATLAGLSLSAGSLSPAFASATTQYVLSVANTVASLTVTPTASDSGATIRVNGSVVASGGSSAALALAVGATTLSLVVSAADGTSTATYTVAVTRAAPSLSSDASLAGLVPSTGNLAPLFASGVTAYSLAVPNASASLTFIATTTSTAASLRINGAVATSGSSSGAVALAVGVTTVSIVVTAEDGVTTATYTLAVTRSAAGSCTLTASETDGPFPLYAVLSNASMARSNITEGKTGVPLALTLTVQDLSNGCTPIAGAAVYIWHCDKDGLYSGYSSNMNAGQAGLTYLRGIQLTDASGVVRFTTIYPGWYAGRITHIHVQVYLNNNLVVTATATTQLAFPVATTATVYASALYTKGQNTSVTSFAADNVFSDGTSTEMVAISGDTANGYAASMTITMA